MARHNICFLLMVSFFSCTYHSEEELIGIADCQSEEISFSTHVLPVIQNNCAIPSCHASGSPQPAFINFATIANNAQTIKIRINNGTMPPPSSGKSLSQEEIKNITCWIEEGPLDN